MVRNKKIGVGICTYNRPDYFNKVVKSVVNNSFHIDNIVVCDDGSTEQYNHDLDSYKLIRQCNSGIGTSKNTCIKYLLEKGCEYIFLLEDDITLLSGEVFSEYINAHNITGFHHITYEKSAPNDVILSVDYGKCKIDFYKNPQGAFTFLTKQLIDTIGMYDTNYVNAFEHIDYAYMACKARMAPPFWYNPDINNSSKLLSPIEGSVENSTITGKVMYNERVSAGARYFTKKHGIFTSSIPMLDEAQFIYNIREISCKHKKSLVS